MELIIAALIVGLASGAGVWAVRRRKQAKQTDADAGETGAGEAPAKKPRQLLEHIERGLDHLLPDDVVMVEGKDYLVAGVATVAEPDAPHLAEARLDDAGDEAWLVVCGPRGSSWVQYGRQVELSISDPPSELLDYQGQVFRLEHRGQVTFSEVQGDLGPLPADRCRYWEYNQPGPDRLWVRHDGQRFLVFVGQRLRRHHLTVLPGS